MLCKQTLCNYCSLSLLSVEYVVKMERLKKPFTCYFCHKKIQNDTEMGHTSICGNVLVACPNKCGSYIPRMDMPTHQKECLNRSTRSMTRLTKTTDTVETFEDRADSSRAILERLQREFQKLSTRFSNYEFTKSSTPDIDKITHQTELILEWRKAVDFKLETIQQTLNSFEKNRTESANQIAQVQQNLQFLDKLQLELDLAMESFLKEQNYNRQANLEFAQNLNTFKDLFEDVTSSFNLLLSELRSNFETLKQQMDEQKTKNVSIVFDIKTISQIASETAEKLELQEKEFSKFREQLEQLKLDFEILENLASSETTTSTPGHLIWKLSDFEAKMHKSKAGNCIVKSPVFYSHKFGYKIRVLVYLNGLKKWKDRYCLISLLVLKGDYDELLKWPCHIEGIIILRDQANPELPKNFSKYIVAKRQEGDEETEEPQESSSSFIFISHSNLIKFVQNNQLFLEIRIDQKRLTETTL